MTDADDPHALHRMFVRATAHGILVWCRCGQWEGWWNGPRGQAEVLDDWDHHRRAAANGANIPPVE